MIVVSTHHWYFWETASVVYTLAVALARSARARTIFWVNMMVVVCVDIRNKRCAKQRDKAQEEKMSGHANKQARNSKYEHHIMLRINYQKKIAGGND